MATRTMVKIPDDLARAIQSGDCVLWVGAGFGALAGRPGWAPLLRRLVTTCPEDARESLEELLEQGRLRTVLTYVHRHFGDAPLAELLEEVSREGDAAVLAEGTETLAELPWRACFATTYADLVARIFASRKPEVLSHLDAHHLSLRDREGSLGPQLGERMLVLRTPPTGRAMRADGVFYDLVEEVVRSRTILFLGFDPDDPDLVQIFDLLDRVGRGNTHFALLPWVSPPEAEELKDRFAIEVIPARGDASLGSMFGELARACAEVAVRPSDAAAKLTALDLGRAVRGVDLRADLALDEALSLDIEWIEHLVDALPAGSLTGLSASTLLRTGAVMLAHGRIDRARRCFQQVITQGAGREFINFARFDLAWTALYEGDRAVALDGLATCAEVDRSLAVVPPRFHIREVLGRDGTSLLLLCRDRESKTDYEIAVATLARPVGVQEHARFQAGAELLAKVEHPAIRGVRGGFADGRLFGLMREPTPGFVLADTLDEQPIALDKTLELLTPVIEGLAACHGVGLLHRNINPSHVVVAAGAAVLRGFGFPPVIAFARPSVRAANRGYMAPELLAGAAATTASDVYSIGALTYRLLTGRAPAGSLAPAHERNVGLDPRVDELLRRTLHPDVDKRPSLGQLREELQQIAAGPRVAELGVPRAIVDRPSGGSAAVPVMIEETVSAPLGQKFLPPADPDDLEAWAWILERKPTHVEARDAVARIEASAREAAQWDRVAEAVKVRAQHTQAVRERTALMRELGSIYETKLGAPASAFEILQTELEELPIAEQHDSLAELARLAELTGQWSQLAESMQLVADRTPELPRQAELYRGLGAVLAGRLGASERAVEAYEKANEAVPTAEGLLAVIPLYRKLGQGAELAGALLTLADLQTGFDRHNTLCTAAKVLREQLGDEDGALGAIEIVLAEDPDHGDALAAGESLARSLDRKPALVDILARRAQLAHGDDDAAQ
ncbi:MAG: protein kinase, partial [Deltaproteobacteria bacterium]|nr:protein kinase [Nannocystaceae bacterium]